MAIFLRSPGLREPPLHLELLRNGREDCVQIRKRNIEPGGIELDAHQKPGGIRVGMFIGVQNVSAMPVNEF